MPLPGFDLGTSPLEYTPARVAGRTIVFTTTNGTRALDACRSARLVVAGAFVNREALLGPLADATHIDLVCAGTEGEVSWEDTLFAGSLVDRILEVGAAPDLILNEGAQAALNAWRQVAPTGHVAAALGQILRRGRGGRNLLSIGRGEDIDWAAQIDCLHVVPWYRPSDGRLVAWTPTPGGQQRGAAENPEQRTSHVVPPVGAGEGAGAGSGTAPL